MLSDRTYMRGDYQRERTSPLTWLISAIIAGFALQLLVQSPLVRGGGRFEELLGLSVEGLKSGWGWTLFTHAFLHSTKFIVHVFINLLALYFLGRELLPMLGARRFLGLFATATVAGGAVWAATHWQTGGAAHVGAAAAVEALFIVFACFFPNQQLRFLLFFLFPVTVTPKQVAFTLAGVVAVAFFCYEIPGTPLPLDLGFASSAHLGGMITGYLYYRFVHDSPLFASGGSEEIELPRWLRRVKKNAPEIPGETDESPPAGSREDIRAEVDRVLDKINSDGFGALTAAERQVLEDAKDLLSRH